jgi:hypothetical protein
MLLRRKQVLEIDAALGALAQHAKGVKLAYAIAKNRASLRGEVEAIREADKPTAEFLTYEERRIAAAKAHAKKDAQGEPVIAGNAYVLEDQAAFDATLGAIRQQHAEAIAAREAQLVELGKLLDDAVEVALHRVKLEAIEAPGAIAEDVAIADLLVPLVGTVIDEG